MLLRGPGTLTRGERELIAAYVSALNDCRYCTSAHSACAAAQLPEGMTLVEQVRVDATVAKGVGYPAGPELVHARENSDRC